MLTLILLDIYSRKEKWVCVVLLQRTTFSISIVTELFFYCMNIIMWPALRWEYRISQKSQKSPPTFPPSKDKIWLLELYTNVWILYKWITQGMLNIVCIWYQLLTWCWAIKSPWAQSLHGVIIVYLFYQGWPFGCCNCLAITTNGSMNILHVFWWVHMCLV